MLSSFHAFSYVSYEKPPYSNAACDISTKQLKKIKKEVGNIRPTGCAKHEKNQSQPMFLAGWVLFIQVLPELATGSDFVD